jgi:hypothetical protein
MTDISEAELLAFIAREQVALVLERTPKTKPAPLVQDRARE